ncbi:MAG: hypothetical protein MI919_03475 [Holophagales bacterium]|nr:hypothetical protein [Holophagales bacterium]
MAKDKRTRLDPAEKDLLRWLFENIGLDGEVLRDLLRDHGGDPEAWLAADEVLVDHLQNVMLSFHEELFGEDSNAQREYRKTFASQPRSLSVSRREDPFQDRLAPPKLVASGEEKVSGPRDLAPSAIRQAAILGTLFMVMGQWAEARDEKAIGGLARECSQLLHRCVELLQRISTPPAEPVSKPN